MKKLVCGSLTLLAAALFAAPEKVASVRIGGTEKIVAAFGQIGQFTGNEGLGPMLSGPFMQSEAVQYFGPTRVGANVFVQIYHDATRTNDSVSATVLYPVVAKKAKFLKHHKGAVEKDGVITMPKGKDGDLAYVVFAKDGKWAALAKRAALAKQALGDVAEAERPLGSDLLRLDIASRGMAEICKAAAATREKGRKPEDRIDRAVLDVLKSIDYGSLAIRITPAGIDFEGTAQVKPGTELAKSGLSPYDEKVFASFGKEVLAATAVGKDSLMPRQKGWKELLAFLRAHGLKPDFITREEKPGLTRITLDPKALVAYLSGPATNALAKLDKAAFAKDFQKFLQNSGDEPYVAQNPPSAVALAVKGNAGRATPAERLAAILPETAGKKPFYVSCGSAYAAVRMTIPALLKLAGEEKEAQLAPMMMLLSPDTAAAGIASAGWRDGDSERFVLRISAAEIKGFSTLGMLAACAQSEESDDGDEDDAVDAADDDKDED